MIEQLLGLQRQAGNRAVTLAIQRWYEPAPNSLMPVGGILPVGRRQPFGVRWNDNRKDPKEAYRFVDATGQGWEAKTVKDQLVMSDWNVPKQQPTKIHWYDATSGQWKHSTVPDTYRKAQAGERPNIEDFASHGYASTKDVPVHVKMRYRRKPTSKKSKGRHPADVRALDRIARRLMKPLPEESTPHLAAAVLGGKVGVAGNTGARHVTDEEANLADSELDELVDSTKPLPPSGRKRKDAIKLRALLSGDYQATHEGVSLGPVTEALRAGTEWYNVGTSGGSAEHGELTVLRKLLGEMRGNPPGQPTPVIVPLGGVKLACQACWWTIGIVNEHIAEPLGYKVRVAGTHGILFPGWQAPEYLWSDATMRAKLRANLPSSWRLDAHGVLIEDVQHKPDSTEQDPDESDSEWEEIED